MDVTQAMNHISLFLDHSEMCQVLSVIVFRGLSRLVYPLYALWLLASSLMQFFFTYQKKNCGKSRVEGNHKTVQNWDRGWSISFLISQHFFLAFINLLFIIYLFGFMLNFIYFLLFYRQSLIILAWVGVWGHNLFLKI